MNLGGRGCSEPGSRHCTPAWVTRAKLRLKQTKKKTNKKRKLGNSASSIETALKSSVRNVGFTVETGYSAMLDKAQVGPGSAEAAVANSTYSGC